MPDNTYSQKDQKLWLAPTISYAISGTVSLPGSKSLTNRELVLSALAQSPTHLRKPLDSRDSQLMIESLRRLGTQITGGEGGDLVIVPPTTDISINTTIDCGLAGTVMRFVPPMAALFEGTIVFDGDEAARRRPMNTTIDSLRALGVNVSDSEGLPFTISSSGVIEGGYLEIDASASSQFVSGLLLAAPRFTNGLELRHVGKHLPSLPHIEMTLECLRERGVAVSQPEPTLWKVLPGPMSGGEKLIEPDLSNAGPFLAAALVTGGTVTVSDWPSNTTQVGKHFVELLTQMGADVKLVGTDLVVTGTGSIQGIDVDLSIGGELAPVILALAALADTPSRITGISHLRGHETNRLAALTNEINNIGGHATELEDGIAVLPSDNLQGGLWQTYQDHRMATAGAIIGLRVAGIEIEDINVVAKTMPTFVELWTALLERKA